VIYKEFEKLNQYLPPRGRILGLDVGTKTIGVAICDEGRDICNPKLTIKRAGNSKDFAKIAQIVAENKIVGIFIGLPLNMDGSASKMSEFAENFARNLDEFLQKNGTKIGIGLVDERLSSFMAEEILLEGKLRNKAKNKKKVIDQVAASIILQDGLEQLNLIGSN
jgi:putative holliday junction resolvase